MLRPMCRQSKSENSDAAIKPCCRITRSRLSADRQSRGDVMRRVGTNGVGDGGHGDHAARADAGRGAVLPDGLPGRGIPRPPRAGLRQDWRQRCRRRCRACTRRKASRFPASTTRFTTCPESKRPGAYLLLDGRTKKVTVYLPPRNQRLEAAEGRVLSADDVELVKRISGADDVAPLSAMATPGWPLVLGDGAGRHGTRRRPRRRGAGDLRGVQPGRESRTEPRRARLG